MSFFIMANNSFICLNKTVWICLYVCMQDLQESEVCQDELALKVQQLKAELVLFKGLMSNVSVKCETLKDNWFYSSKHRCNAAP